MKRTMLALCLVFQAAFGADAQLVHQYESEAVKLLFFDKSISRYVPHIIREHSLGLGRHDMLWNGADTSASFHYRPEQTFMYLTDWNDDGNGGVNVIPNNFIMVGMAPLGNAYNVSPSVERYRHLFSHEMTHLFMTDKPTSADLRWRKFFGAKVPTDSESPVSAFWSYLSTPRWYNPRWYQEGIACFLETAMDGGVGRAQGTYDEMYFRALVDGGKGLYSAVGLEAEGTSADFQLGTASYLYGTRFVNYLALRHGTDSLFSFYNRTPGSKRFFASQFKKVYGRPLAQVWDEWRSFEAEHQEESLRAIAEHPLTELVPLSGKAMGSVCPPVYDPLDERLYLAANYRGRFAHVSYIDLRTGKEKILREVDGPMMYLTTYLTLDRKRGRLIYNIHNADFRGIEAIDAQTGRRLARLKLQRVSNLAYDNSSDCLWGIMSNGGVNHLVRYSADLQTRDVFYSFSFGQSVSDLAVSDSGDRLLAKLTKPDGSQCLISFSTKGLAQADLRFEEVLQLDNASLVGFRFADNDSTLVGSSDYTGVQNLWSLDLASKEMRLLTNVKTGIFAPVPYKADSLVALCYEAGGMRPVKLARAEVSDASGIDLLGRKVFESNPGLESLGDDADAPVQSYSEIHDKIAPYRPIKEMRFAGAFPDISGFRDVEAPNNVTPVLGYSFLFRDPVGLNSLSLRLGVSPWSHNEPKKQLHASLKWDFWSWTLSASYNPTCFYDLVGPVQRSRSGYNVGLSYKRSRNLFPPLRLSWSLAANTYGMMDALPLFQEVDSPVSKMQTLQGSLSISKTRTSLGGLTAEAGYSLGLAAYSYFASLDGKYNSFPSLVLKADKGFLLPVGSNNSFWLRTSAGQSFGSTASSFGYQFFGGFRNNIVDNGPVLRYRETSAFPGARVDEIPAHTFAKVMGELSLTPIRLKNFGAPGLYPSYLFFSIFSGDLLADPWGSGQMRNFIDVGAQVNVEMVLFSYLKTTWSVGYARLFGPDGKKSGELMLSLKLL